MCSIGSNSTAGIGALSKGAIGGGNSIGGAASGGTLMGGSVARMAGGTSTLMGRTTTPNPTSPNGGDGIERPRWGQPSIPFN